MSTTITFGRGSFTIRRRLVNTRFDATEHVTLTLALADGTTATEDWFADSDQCHVNATRVTREQFDAWCKAHRIDWQLLTLRVTRKDYEQSAARTADMRAFGYSD